MKRILYIFIAILTLSFSVASHALNSPYVTLNCLDQYNQQVNSWRGTCFMECKTAVENLGLDSTDTQDKIQDACNPFNNNSFSAKDMSRKACQSNTNNNQTQCSQLIDLAYSSRQKTCADMKMLAGNACNGHPGINQSLVSFQGSNNNSCPANVSQLGELTASQCSNAANECLTFCTQSIEVNNLNNIYIRGIESANSASHICSTARDTFKEWIVGDIGKGKLDTAIKKCNSENNVERKDDSEEVAEVNPADSVNTDTTDDSETKDKKKGTAADKITSGLNTLGNLSQMAMPFLTSGTTTPSELGYNYGSIPSGYTTSGDMSNQPWDDVPNLTEVGEDSLGSMDIPTENPNQIPAAENNTPNNPMNNNNGMMGAGGMMNNMGGNNTQGGGAPRRSGGRPVSKKDKTLFSNRLKDSDGGSSFDNPSATTAGATRKTGYTKDGRRIDQRFDPNKYQLKIQTAYDKGLNSKAMAAAMRRAAGYEASAGNTGTSQGYSNWHKKYNIHPGRLSIFKQVRVCYIIKYSSYSGDCGPINPSL